MLAARAPQSDRSRGGGAGRAGDRGGAGPGPSPWSTLHRAIGNRTVGELIAQADVGHSHEEDAAERLADSFVPVPRGPSADRDGEGRLPASMRSELEPHVGADLSRVRVHTDDGAAASAASLGASAFTLGNDVFFARGRYAPNTARGQRLLVHELAHVAQHARGGPPRLARKKDDEGPRMIFIFRGVPDFLDCNLSDVKSSPSTTSCCSKSTLDQVPGLYKTSRDWTDRALERMKRGDNMDGAIKKSFGADALWKRSEIERRLRLVRAALDNEKSHTILCRIAQLARSSTDVDWSKVDRALMCKTNVLASATVGGTTATLCVDIDGNPAGGWATLLHEMVHIAGVGDLPDRDDATPAQMEAGEFETYKGEDRFPNPTVYSLRNADSYSSFVGVVGAPDWTSESNAARFLPTLEAGPILTLQSDPRFGIGARAQWTPLGSNLQFVFGLSGLFLPRNAAAEAANPPPPTALRAYAGPELGLRWIVGGAKTQFVLDVAAGAGPYVTVNDSVDPAILSRVGLGLRFGGPQASFGVSADVIKLFHFDQGNLVGDARTDWLGGLFLRGSWGGSANTPR